MSLLCISYSSISGEKLFFKNVSSGSTLLANPFLSVEKVMDKAEHILYTYICLINSECAQSKFVADDILVFIFQRK